MLSVKRLEREGFVAIVVAAMIMVILSLITIGFTRMMQREQRQAIDRQLTRQALYAAESGVNDVYEYLQNADPMTVQTEKTTCDVDALNLPNNGVIGGEVEYTCILYDKTPGELFYSVGTSESKVSQLITTPENPGDPRNPFDSIRIRWTQEDGLNNIPALPTCANAGVFPGGRAGNVPLIRMDITNTSTLSRDALINATDYLYISPCSGSGGTNAHSYLAGQRGTVIPVTCIDGEPVPCELTINFGTTSSSSYVTRFRTVYDSALVTIDGRERLPAGGTGPVSFDQAQTSIDVTARAADVVRRLRVSIPLSQPNNPPESVFHAFDGVCKLLDVDTVSSPARIIDRCPTN